MRSLSLACLAILIALASLQVIDLSDIDFSTNEQNNSMSAIDHSILSPVKEIVSKKTMGLTFIAQDFLAIVLIATASFFVLTYSFYIPIYRLYRQKNYFLRI